AARHASADRSLPPRSRSALPPHWQTAGGGGTPHRGDDDVPRDGDDVLAGAGRGGRTRLSLMRCPRCSFENREGIRFCEECGGKLEQACPACGMAVPPGRKFCGGCGEPLIVSGSSSPTPTVRVPTSYTPRHLVEKILSSKSALEGERKQVTVLF